MNNSLDQKLLWIGKILIEQFNSDIRAFATWLSSQTGTLIEADVLQGWLVSEDSEGELSEEDITQIDHCLTALETLSPQAGVEPDSDVYRNLDSETVRLLQEFEQMPEQIRQELLDIVKAVVDNGAAKRISK